MLHNGLILPEAAWLHVPAKARTFRVAPGCHRLTDEVLTARMGEYLRALVGAPYYACVILTSGEGALIPSGGRQAEYPADKQDYLIRLVETANRGSHYGGAWIGVWKDASRLSLLWKDADGDVVATVEDESPWPRMRLLPVDHYVNLCDAAVRKYFAWLRDHDVRPEQQIKRAQGQENARQD